MTTACAVGLGVLAARDARAGNLDTFMLGNDAALKGGAVTATATGSSAIWYNPAGLASERFASVDVSFSAYMLRFAGSPDLTVDESRGGDRTKLTNLDVSPIPTALAYTRRLGGWQVGAGLFVPNRGLSLPRTLVRLRTGDQVSSIAQDGSSRFSEYYAGLAVGRPLTSRFRIGAAFYGYYSSRIDTETLYAGATNGPQDAFGIAHATVDQLRLGYQLVWGMQLSPDDNWQLGMTFRAPVVLAYQLTQTVDVSGTAASGEGQASSGVEFNEKTTTKPAIIRPMRVHVGGSFRRHRWQVAIDASVQAPYNSATAIEDSSRTVWNVRVGALKTVSERLAVGGGVFTDRTPYAAETSARRGSLDYYGISVALQLSDILRVRSDDEPRERSLIFGSTFALSYAFGTGILGNQELAADSGGGARTNLRFDSVTAHEFLLHVGSTLSR